MFEKRPFTIQEQIERLETRGLIITPEDNATHYLSHISYYRLGEYWHSMQSDKINHIFKENSKFKDVIALYEFDSELRVLLFDIIEKIEISLRTKLIYHLSHEFSPWWFQNFDLFIDSKALVKTLSSLEEELERTKETTIKNHFKNHKDDLRFPPAWKSLEQTSFGSLSKLYGNLKNTVKSKDIIAKEFGVVNHTFCQVGYNLLHKLEIIAHIIPDYGIKIYPEIQNYYLILHSTGLKMYLNRMKNYIFIFAL